MKKIILFVLLTIIVFFVPSTSYAANVCAGAGDAAAIGQCINNIYRISIGVAALLALLMMILGGYYYMTAAGNAERSGKGTDIIMSSLLGIVILFGAYLLLNTINPDLVNFKLKNFDQYKTNTTP